MDWLGSDCTDRKFLFDFNQMKEIKDFRVFMNYCGVSTSSKKLIVFESLNRKNLSLVACFSVTLSDTSNSLHLLDMHQTLHA